MTNYISSKPPLIIIGGATGVGKTSLSVLLAQKVNGSIISADSMQVYRGFNIGSAKIRPEEMQGVRHYLIDILNTEQEFNVFEFRRLALEAIKDIYSRGEIPIIVGGTGFYVQSVLYDIQFNEKRPDEEYRQEMWRLSEVHGAEYLHDKLTEVDAESAAAIPANNIKRVIRALEYFHETGEKISIHNAEQRKRTSPYDFTYFVLNRPRDIIYKRVEMRVEMMIEDGLEKEVLSLLNSGVSPECQPMKGLGYKEMCQYLLPEWADDKYGSHFETIEECCDAIKLNTRHFAKRQITWFKREKDAIWIELEGKSGANVLTEMEDALSY